MAKPPFTPLPIKMQVKQSLEEEPKRFEKLNEEFDVPKEELEEAINKLLREQEIAETGDWVYYVTEH